MSQKRSQWIWPVIPLSSTLLFTVPFTGLKCHCVRVIVEDPSVPITGYFSKYTCPCYVFIIALGSTSANKFLTFVGLLTPHKIFQQIFNLEMIFIPFNGLSDSLYTTFYFLWAYFASSLILKFNDLDNITPWVQNMTSAQKNSISTPYTSRTWWRMKQLFNSFPLLIN